MGIAEIQAALAQGATANPFAAPAPAAFQPQPVPAAFQPSPFAPPATAAPNPFGGSPAPAPLPQVAEVRTGGPGKLGVSFTPPTPAPVSATPNLFSDSPAPAQSGATGFAFNPPPGFNPASAPPINPVGERASLNTPAPAAPAPAASFTEPQAPAEPKRRGRKPKAEPAITITGQTGVVAVDVGSIGGEALASPAELVLGNISTEDLVAVLRDRGYSVWLEAK